MSPKTVTLLNNVIVGLLGILLLYVSMVIILSGHTLVGAGALLFTTLFVIVYIWARAYTWRYLFPGLFGFGLFVIFPLAYTVYISFTNYSSRNLLRYEQVLSRFQKETYLAEGSRLRFSVYPQDDEAVRIFLDGGDGQLYLSEAVELTTGQQQEITAEPVEQAPPGETLPMRDVVQLRTALQEVAIELPDGTVVKNTGLRDFGPVKRLYEYDADTETLTNLRTGAVLEANKEIGFFVNQATGEAVTPGFRTWIGLDNYLSIITDKGIRGPFIKIFIWTVLFAFGSVFFTLCVGMFLSVLLQWKDLQFRKAYRTLLILPYAVPAFISILIFRGLFNQNFGEINMLLDWAFGIKPEWFANPYLAKTMILLVNTWLGYPYMMIVCTGILQSVPDTIYEASALDGSNPLADFFFLTLPLIFKPLFPLLVASFAFNFNNFLIIYLLTGGGPDMVGATTVAGETDILVSYTFRIAFRDSSQLFGYASAIATIIFIIVALISWWNLRLNENRG